MKRKIVNVLLAAAVITAMMFSVTACGSKTDETQDGGANTALSAAAQQEVAESVTADDDVQESDADDDEESTMTDDGELDADDDGELDADDDGESTVTDDEELDADDDGESDMTLQKWINSEECAQFSELMNEGLDGMVISFEVEDDMISMIFTMEEAIDVADGAEEAMNEYFTSNSAIFEAIRDQLIYETGNDNTVLRLVYRNADDSEIFSMDF